MITDKDLQKIGKLVNSAIDDRVPIIVEKQLKPIKKQLDRIDNHLHFNPIQETPPSKYIQRTQAQLAK